MARKRRKEHIVEAEIIFNVKVIIRDDMDVKDLIKKETEFIAEPQSANGCIKSMSIKKITKK